MSRAERVYRVFLRAYPASTRKASGEGMVQLFADRLRDADSSPGKARVWLEAIADIATTAPRERVTVRRAVRVAGGPVLEAPSRSDLVVAASPLLLVAILALARPGYYEPLFDDRVGLLGLPAGIAVLDLAAILATVGVFLARRTDLGDPRVQVVALVGALAPVPVLVVTMGLRPTVAYAMAATLFVVTARFRMLMVALAVPFAVCRRLRSHASRPTEIRIARSPRSFFISPSTVEYHLRKAFRRLDVTSRTQLANRLR